MYCANGATKMWFALWLALYCLLFTILAQCASETFSKLSSAVQIWHKLLSPNCDTSISELFSIHNCHRTTKVVRNLTFWVISPQGFLNWSHNIDSLHICYIMTCLQAPFSTTENWAIVERQFTHFTLEQLFFCDCWWTVWIVTKRGMNLMLRWKSLVIYRMVPPHA